MNFKPTLAKKDCYRGDTARPIPVIFKNTDGELINTTGYKIWLTVRDKPAASNITSDDDAQIHKELDGDSTGVATFYLLSSDTDIPVGTYYYDIQYRKPDGVTIKTVGVGEFIIYPEATRSR